VKYNVDIEAGNALVERLKKKAPAIGGFNGMMKVPSGYEEPVLVSGADGVGTKINICKISRDFTTIGIDLVAMCVNDVITCGAKPLYFLDYISTGKLTPIVDDILEGILKGCQIASIDLLGGETAEHTRTAPPPNYGDDIDLAGFCTGIVEKGEVIDGSLIKKGDKIIGLPSSGIHSNGYSLINEMLWRHKIAWADTPELLTPTTIYARQIEVLLQEYPIVGMAHITGGGLEENVSRVIPKGLKAQIDWSSWERPEIFNKIQKAGEIEEQEMRRVFNCGIGYVLVIPPDIDYGVQIGEVCESS
jgi:phosphoribosylformylglycinamidine cyclo-ligase|tara:strand:+ start:273 stop:1181 length:909 start_codon:yes stop_codon:yes gene_type:complete